MSSILGLLFVQVIELRDDEGIVGDLLELDAVEVADGAGFRFGVAVAVVDFFDAIGCEHLGATCARLGGAGDELDVAAGEEGAEVHFRVEHVFAPLVAVEPELVVGIEAGGEAVVGGADDAIVVVKGDGPDFAEGVFGAQAGDMGEGHGVFGDGQPGAMDGGGHGGRKIWMVNFE